MANPIFTDEMNAKLAYEANNLAQSQSGTLGPCAQTMRERLESRRYRAKLESKIANDLEELIYLLDKHPDVARILELSERTAI